MTSRRTITVLGATGSVGASTLDLIRQNRLAFDVVALTAHSDVTALAAAVREFGAAHAVIARPELRAQLEEALAGTGCTADAGPAAVIAAASMDAEWTMAAIVGCAGLEPTMAALERGRTVALANKEALVSAGEIMMRAVRRTGATLLPVDSEHNAVFQCLAGNNCSDVAKITLTASGGPFRERALADMAQVTPAQAVKHPTWSMGAKISVDSATMMNKGLELIEAYHLFGLDSARLAILVHPQSVVHSMVEYVDGSVIAQLGSADMRIPIASALAWPKRMLSGASALDLAALGQLTFEAPDDQRFPALALARTAMEDGGSRPAVLNAANETAVAAFLNDRIGFLAIADIVRSVLEGYDPVRPDSIDDVLAIDAQARRSAEAAVERRSL